MKFVNKSKTGKRPFNSQQSKKQIKNNELSRKQMRKMIRKQKKQRNKHYHQNHQHHQSGNQKNIKLYNHSKKNNNIQQKPQKRNTQVQKDKKQIKKKSQIDPQILQEQQQIKFYQKKLGITQKGNKYKNIMKGMGYDDDLFDFLQNISKKVKMNKNEYEAQKQDFYDSEDHQQMSQNLQQQEEFQSNDSQQNFQQSQNNLNQNSEIISEEQEQVDEISNNINQNMDHYDTQNMDHYDTNYWPEGFKPFNQKNQPQNNNEDKNKKQKQSNQLKQHQKDRKKLFQLSNKQQAEQFQIKKSFTSLFNKLSDGNIMITFRQMRQIFNNHSSSSSIPVFIKLFQKFNVQVEKPHLHILLSNIVLSAGLHQLLGNRFMAPLVAQLIDRFNILQNQTQDQTQIQQIGYSKLFQKSKNCVIILSYFYEFGSLTGDFILSFVKQLSKELSKTHIQFLYLIIQKIGNKIRQNDPAVLKNIIEQLKTAISSFKIKQSKQVSEQITKKIDIIQIQLNELRFNRKNETFNDQRMAFFYTFINKNIPAEITNEKQIFVLNYQQIKLATKNKTNWWETAEFNSKVQHFSEKEEQLIQVDKDKQQLLSLAKSLHLVTQIRKSIFLQIMQSQDYIQASQRVLSLKIKNMQQIATVLVQVCVLEPTFNPFYPLVAAKIANIIPKFRLNIQYGIWDHIKLIDQYDLRKTSNLAKFCSRFVSNPMSNGSLSILKTFADLINVSPSVTLFLKVFFKQFLKNVKTPYLAQLSKKLQEQNNRGIKQSIQQYLAQIGLRQKSFGFEQKMKVLRKLLSIQRQDKE